MGKSSDADRFTPKSSHTVLTKWYDKNDRVIKPLKTDFLSSKTIHTMLEKTPPKNSVIIVKSENIKLTAYKRGKILYSTEDTGNRLSGERYTFIPADELKKGDTLYLNITPKQNVTGAIKSPVYLGFTNDFLFTVIVRSKADIAVLSAIATGVLLLTSYAVIKRKKKAVYPLALLLNIALFVFVKSDLFQFIIGSSEMKAVFAFTSYSLLPVTFTAFGVRLTKRSKTAACFQVCITAYTLLRLILFTACEVPIERGIIISHIILISGILLLLYLINKKREGLNPPAKL
ncbi:MAG: hypothetical protein IJS03_03350 [Eubacterium sp.]|nr:hypothetical protein [Eubacterium sp.]